MDIVGLLNLTFMLNFNSNQSFMALKKSNLSEMFSFCPKSKTFYISHIFEPFALTHRFVFKTFHYFLPVKVKVNFLTEKFRMPTFRQNSYANFNLELNFVKNCNAFRLKKTIRQQHV